MKTKHSTFNIQHPTLAGEASGIAEVQRKEMEAAMREWRGFWRALLLCLAFSVTAALVLLAIIF